MPWFSGPGGSPCQPAKVGVTPGELPPQADKRPAAVLCLLFEGAEGFPGGAEGFPGGAGGPCLEGGETCVVLTRRAAHLSSHAGEVSFPGGRLSPGELPVAAALREAYEEIGVAVGDVEVIGELSPLTTRSSPASVYCFVGTFAGPGPGVAAFVSIRTRWSGCSGFPCPAWLPTASFTRNCGRVPTATQGPGWGHGTARSPSSPWGTTSFGVQPGGCSSNSSMWS